MSKIIGITGNIASGKSRMLDILSAAGYRVLSSDEFIRDLYKDLEIQAEVLKIIPELENFDKKKIAKIIYQQNERRLALEGLIHPLLIEKIKSFSSSLTDLQIGFVEVPLLFEKDLSYLFDFVLLACCNIFTRTKRAVARGLSEEEFIQINNVQMPESDKIEKADFVINTDVKIEELQDQINLMIEEIKCAK